MVAALLQQSWHGKQTIFPFIIRASLEHWVLTTQLGLWDVMFRLMSQLASAQRGILHARNLTIKRERKRERLNWSIAQKSQLELTWSTDDEEVNKDE